jgi:hypothetical protein
LNPLAERTCFSQVARVEAGPLDYEGIVFQTSMAGWPEDQQVMGNRFY